MDILEIELFSQGGRMTKSFGNKELVEEVG
jgi:hypothetical protein